MLTKRFTIILGVIATLLLVPLIAMQFTSEVNWSPADFVIMGLMLLAVGAGIEIVLRKVTSTRGRVILCVAILGVFLLLWAEMAVGIFNSPIAGSWGFMRSNKGFIKWEGSFGGLRLYLPLHYATTLASIHPHRISNLLRKQTMVATTLCSSIPRLARLAFQCGVWYLPRLERIYLDSHEWRALEIWWPRTCFL